MKIEITTTKIVKETIDVEFPYYYKHDLMSDYGENVIYGKITEDYAYTIQEIENYDGKLAFELEKDTWDGSYFKEEYKSTKEEYEDAKRRALEFFNCL
jgi:hypothetical protein